MKNIFITVCLLFACTVFAQKKTLPLTTARSRTINFDKGWLFIKGNIDNVFEENYDDTRWRMVDLPHDWSIEDLPAQIQDSVTGPFSKASAGKAFTGHTVGGTGWYRKKFSTPAALNDKSIYLQFDGVYMHAQVWVNGHYLGNHPDGYTPFYFDIAPYLHKDGRINVIAVKVRNHGQNSRWYSGSGIYRHVWLTTVASHHIAPMGVYAYTSALTPDNATINIQTTLQNRNASAQSFVVKTLVLDAKGKQVAAVTTKPAAANTGLQNLQQQLSVHSPNRWSVDSPYLYQIKTLLLVNNRVTDSLTTSFGIRSLKVDAQNGLLINGKRVILKGGCVHHDNGPLGACAFDRAEERKLMILKAQGYNAIRTSHNPPSPYFLEVCDRLGLLVIDEAFDVWEHKKLFADSLDYHHFFKDWWQKDLDAQLLRDRNHPSVIMWSIGNEIYERADTFGIRITKQLINRIRELDNTRLITEGLCWFWDHPGKPWEDLAPAFKLLDVSGYNYEWQRYADDHRKDPSRVIVGTETYGQEALENFDFAEKNPYVLGDFVWTAWDYIGEAGIGHALVQPDTLKADNTMLQSWPWYNAWCGDIDITGNKKPASFYKDVVWRNSKVEIMVQRPQPTGKKSLANKWGWPDELNSWTWPGHEGDSLLVRVFSRDSLIKLELNGNIIGEARPAANQIITTFKVAYKPGVLKATGYNGTVLSGSGTLTTTGAPYSIKLWADSNNSIAAKANDIYFIQAGIADKQGNIVPDESKPVVFSVTGAGELLATANANPVDMTGFRNKEKQTFNGRALLVIRAKEKGNIHIRASAQGLHAGEIVVPVVE